MPAEHKPNAPATPPAPPYTLPQLLDRDFLPHRAKLLDLAAFLDRCDRTQPPSPREGPGEGAPGSGNATTDSAPTDPRLPALLSAIALLTDNHPNRTQRILDALSDPTTDPLNAAPQSPVLGVPQNHAPLTTDH